MQEKVFKILKPEIVGKEVVFRYEILDLKFEERQVFPFELKDLKSVYDLAIATSISYYKLHLADEVYIDWKISESEKDFWKHVFDEGFSELMYENKISFGSRNKVAINSSEEVWSKTYNTETGGGSNLEFKELAILGIGGGKDSSLGKVLLNEAGVEVLGYSTEVRESEIIDRNAKALSVPLLQVQRKIDDKLRQKISGTYNGHIPISLVYAMTGVVIAEHKQAKYVVVANEASADEENIFWEGKKINHQWSKTFEFEQVLNKHILENINPQINYFSILRNLPSAKIGKMFAEKCLQKNENLMNNFSSCNNNFKLNKTNDSDWCGVCAKCVGTYILLNPFLSNSEMQEIFKSIFLDNPENEDMIKALLGMTVPKPFDCVATISEMNYLLSLSNPGSEFLGSNDLVKSGKEYSEKLFEHNIPENIHSKIYDK